MEAHISLMILAQKRVGHTPHQRARQQPAVAQTRSPPRRHCYTRVAPTPEPSMATPTARRAPARLHRGSHPRCPLCRRPPFASSPGTAAGSRLPVPLPLPLLACVATGRRRGNTHSARPTARSQEVAPSSFCDSVLPSASLHLQ
jgi:hypothetical protein